MKTLLKIIEGIGFRHASEVFNDLLTVTLDQFTLPGTYIDDWHHDSVKHYSKEDRPMFGQFFTELMQTYQAGIDSKGWCDPLGDLYMELTGKYKTSTMGQFFTPEPICSFMAQMTVEKGAIGKRISDPTCGSGRTLLAANAICPGNIYFAEDLDYICAKMAALNFIIHGMRAEVVCHNSLTEPDSFRFAFHINSNNMLGPTPHFQVLKKAEDSYVCSYWINRRKKLEKEGKGEQEAREIIIEEKKVATASKQLSLFDAA